jgi:hypothetical protein
LGKRQHLLLPLLHKAHPYLGLNDDDQRGQRLQVLLLVELTLFHSMQSIRSTASFPTPRRKHSLGLCETRTLSNRSFCGIGSSDESLQSLATSDRTRKPSEGFGEEKAKFKSV